MLKSHFRVAFTLVELLVAIAIASVLTLIALPSAKEALRQHTVSRSAEIIRQVFLNARAQAVRQDRSFGVSITRVSDQGVAADYAVSLGFVTATPEYKGDSPTSVATVLGVSSRYTYDLFFPSTGPDLAARLYRDVDIFRDTSLSGKDRNQATLRDGATVVLGDDFGPLRITNVRLFTNAGVNGVRLTAGYEYPNRPEIGRAFAVGAKVKFAIRGVPQESFLPAVDVPRDAVIDLSISGIGLAGLNFNSEAIRCDIPSTPAASTTGFEKIMVLFDRFGRVNDVFYEVWDSSDNAYHVVPQPITGTIYLAIGRADGVRSLDEIDAFDTAELNRGALPNYANPETAWLTIRGSSGSIGLSRQLPAIENKTAYYTARSLTPPSSAVGTCARRAEELSILTQRVLDARQLARSGSTL